MLRWHLDLLGAAGGDWLISLVGKVVKSGVGSGESRQRDFEVGLWAPFGLAFLEWLIEVQLMVVQFASSRDTHISFLSTLGESHEIIFLIN